MADQSSASPQSPSPRRKTWLLTALILSVLGVGISLYATVHHVEVQQSGQTNAACNINDTFSCDDVALSPYSEIAGIPVAVLGLGYFVALAVLLGIGASGGQSAPEHLHGYVALVGIGVLVTLVMAGLSFFKVGAACLSCIGIYTVTLLQAVVLGAFWREVPTSLNFKSMFSGGTTAAIAVAAVVAVFSFMGPSRETLSEEEGSQASSQQDEGLPDLAEEKQPIPIAKTQYSGLGEDYRKGSDNADVVIQEFADFECPACRRMSNILGQLSQQYGDQILVVFRNYPLDQSCNPKMNRQLHQHACNAAILARCAGQYGKFWEFHDLVYANQRQLSEDNLTQWAKQVGLTSEQIATCQDSENISKKIHEDIELAERLGVDSTPTLFINGRKVLGGRSASKLRRQIDKMLD